MRKQPKRGKKRWRCYLSYPFQRSLPLPFIRPYTCTYIYIHIWEREREREKRGLSVTVGPIFHVRYPVAGFSFFFSPDIFSSLPCKTRRGSSFLGPEKERKVSLLHSKENLRKSPLSYSAATKSLDSLTSIFVCTRHFFFFYFSFFFRRKMEGKNTPRLPSGKKLLSFHLHAFSVRWDFASF